MQKSGAETLHFESGSSVVECCLFHSPQLADSSSYMYLLEKSAEAYGHKNNQKIASHYRTCSLRLTEKIVVAVKKLESD